MVIIHLSLSSASLPVSLTHLQGSVFSAGPFVMQGMQSFVDRLPTAGAGSQGLVDLSDVRSEWRSYDRRKFKSQTSDNVQRWKSRGGKSQGGEDKRWRRSKREKVRREKMQVREKVGKSRFTAFFFQWFGAPEGRKVTSLKRWVRNQLARWEMKKYTPLWRESHFQVKMYEPHHSQTTFGSWDVDKVHTLLAWSTFRSQNVQSPDHFWKLRCRKSARHCGTKHISKSKCTKHTRFGPLLEVEMSKKCTPLWREAHFEVKM